MQSGLWNILLGWAAPSQPLLWKWTVGFGGSSIDHPLPGPQIHNLRGSGRKGLWDPPGPLNPPVPQPTAHAWPAPSTTLPLILRSMQMEDSECPALFPHMFWALPIPTVCQAWCWKHTHEMNTVLAWELKADKQVINYQTFPLFFLFLFDCDISLWIRLLAVGEGRIKSLHLPGGAGRREGMGWRRFE